MTSDEIRSTFLEFFKKRGHTVIPSASLIPENDPSVLFNTAGMQPLVPYLLGAKHPAGKRIVDVQKCVRTGDIDEVGDNTHLTFFEMLGNWSLGDYFKKKAIEWSYELLTSKTEGFGLDPQRLYVTCFEGDENASKDEESAEIWKSIFEKNNVSGERIYFMPAEKNWWSPGDNGPCGPDTEMFYDVTSTLNAGLTKEEYMKADEEQKVVEIWNNVFMEYKKKDGKIVGKLDSKNVDTGSGLERVAIMLQGKTNVYDTDLFQPILNVISERSQFEGIKSNLNNSERFGYEKYIRASRIIADHTRASVFIIADGVIPSNTDQGYVLRRLIRRAIFNCHENNLQLMPHELVEVIVQKYQTAYPYLKERILEITKIISNEEIKFLKTLNAGKKELRKMAMGLFEESIQGKVIETGGLEINGKNLFFIYSTHGFPFELSIEEIKMIQKDLNLNFKSFTLSNEEIKVLKEEFDEEMKKHQDLSRAGSEKKFKGGLGDTSEKSLQYHTATHLLNAALRKVLGNHVGQRGSNITPERLRFDFSHTEKMTDKQKKEVERLVNEWIKAELPVGFVEMPKDEAEKVAIHAFNDKYGDVVKVYSIGPDASGNYISREFCGGPHVSNTKELLGTFKIQKEEAVSQGVRRIKAVLE